MKKNYSAKELESMSIIDLISIADQSQIDIQNGFRRGLISDILEKQATVAHIPSELHCRDRYAIADKIKAEMSINQ